jgi:hypothetical protein
MAAPAERQSRSPSRSSGQHQPEPPNDLRAEVSNVPGLRVFTPYPGEQMAQVEVVVPDGCLTEVAVQLAAFQEGDYKP